MEQLMTIKEFENLSGKDLVQIEKKHFRKLNQRLSTNLLTIKYFSSLRNQQRGVR
jgi:hypothetical protein